MATISVATLQTIWGCRWSRPSYRVTGAGGPLLQQPEWICTRDGERAIVAEQRCETCERWEPEPDAVR